MFRKIINFLQKDYINAQNIVQSVNKLTLTEAKKSFMDKIESNLFFEKNKDINNINNLFIKRGYVPKCVGEYKFSIQRFPIIELK